MKRLNIYRLTNNQADCKPELLTSVNVKNAYKDTFYFRPMPTIGKTTCRKILQLLFPHFKANGVDLLFEWDDTKHRGVQKLYRNGTVLNF